MTASAPPYDPRAVANLLLDMAADDQTLLTNLALQKLLYFAHAHFLIETGTPLLSGYFEAWEFGPVHPAVYRSFNVARDRPIAFRARRRDLLSGQEIELDRPDSLLVRRHLRSVLHTYGRLTPGRLVEISHASKGPWAFIKNKAINSVALGLRIPNNVIIERFKHHKVSVGPEPRVGEPSEDFPLATTN